jgi:AcrR family transcriptional regulator
VLESGDFDRPDASMARPRRSEINDDNRREALIRAAARLFNRKGYQGTSVRDIAGATGMRSGSPFYHFASKQDLLFEASMRGLAPALAELEAIWAGRGSTLARFRAMLRTHLGQLLGTDPDMAAMVVSEWRWLEGEQRAQVIALRDRFEQLWQDVLEALAAEGRLPRADPTTRLFFLGALHGVPQWYREGGALGIEQVADALARFVLCTPPAQRPSQRAGSGRRKPARSGS